MNYISELQQAWDAGGWLAASGVGVMLLLRGWSSGPVQRLIAKVPGAPAWVKWENLTPFGKLVLVGVVTAVGSAAVAWATGTGVAAAIGAGITAGLAAVGANSGKNALSKSRVAGAILPKVRQPDIVVPVGKDKQAPVIKPDEK